MADTKPIPFDVAVIGGGISGVILAIALHRRQIPVTIYEQSANFREIGAGVGFGPNAIQAMRICHPGIEEALRRVSNSNKWPEKRNVWLDFLDGYGDGDDAGEKTTKLAFQILFKGDTQSAGAHRAHFLDEVVKLLPTDVAKFGKRLVNITQDSSGGKMVMEFQDGSTAEADAVVGCDGIKSRVRQILLGDDHPAAHPVYTHKYAYRGLVPMEKAIEAVGAERAQNGCLYMGQDAHVITFPIARGTLLNIVAFVTNANDWSDPQKLTRPATREEAMKDYQNFGPSVQALLQMTEPNLDCWAIFDLGDHPVPTYYKGRICLLGDAAHASSPHQGAAAGVAVEDCAILSELLKDGRIGSPSDLETVFATYDARRRERTRWLVQGSRRNGQLFEWQVEGIGRDFSKIEKEVDERCNTLWYVDVPKLVEEAKEELGKRLE